MIQSNPKFKTPPWNATLWRYMSFEKFLDLINTQSLYFSNISSLSDKHEAEIPKKNREKIRETFNNQYSDPILSEKHYMTFIFDLLRKRKASFVNCWILSPDESYALWKVFLGGNKTGVAIKTNTSFLKKSFEVSENNQTADETMFFGRVNYSDFIKGDINIESIILNKIKPYKYEKEARLVIMKDPEFKETFEGKEQIVKECIRIKTEIDILIQELYPSPFGGRLFENVLKSTLSKIHPSLESRIKKSIIKDL